MGPELACLALTIYFEARAEPPVGQLAVATVVMNRVLDEHYPDNVCDVVQQGGERKYRCQFTWWCDGQPDRPYEEEAWDRAILTASAALHGSYVAELRTATHYHANYVRPHWAWYMEHIATFGNHIFYRRPE